MATFGPNKEEKIMTSIYPGNVTTEFKNIIHYYTSITRDMMPPHCGNLWDNNPGTGLGRLLTVYYGAAPDSAKK